MGHDPQDMLEHGQLNLINWMWYLGENSIPNAMKLTLV